MRSCLGEREGQGSPCEKLPRREGGAGESM